MADNLPQGGIPTWIERDENTEDVDVLKCVENRVGESVTVIFSIRAGNEETKTFCQDKKWRYAYIWDICGCEDQDVVLLDLEGDIHGEFLEYLSRARNNLYIISSVRGRR